jgi:predicted nuclease of predicted toxin-antitoxin system
VKLLFDENLPASMVRRLADLFPESAHVVTLGLASVDDLALWSFAKENGFTLVTKDSDFHDLCAVRGAPPKVVWLRVGNCSVNEIEQVLRAAEADIRALDEDPEATELRVFPRSAGAD